MSMCPARRATRVTPSRRVSQSPRPQMLARGGLTGPAPIFEGHSGFFQSVTKPVTIDTDGFGGAGVPFRIEAVGLKAYPAQVYTQTATVAATAIAKEVGNLDRIVSIDV